MNYVAAATPGAGRRVAAAAARAVVTADPCEPDARLNLCPGSRGIGVPGFQNHGGRTASTARQPQRSIADGDLAARHVLLDWSRDTDGMDSEDKSEKSSPARPVPPDVCAHLHANHSSTGRSRDTTSRFVRFARSTSSWSIMSSHISRAGRWTHPSSRCALALE